MPFSAVGHRVAFADVRAGGKAALAGDFLQEQDRFDGFTRVGQGFWCFCYRVTKTLRRRIDGGPQAVIVGVVQPIARGIARGGEMGGGDQAVTVVARADALFERFCLLRQSHWFELNMRNARAGANPNASLIVREELLDAIISQIAPALQILAAVAFRCRKIQSH